MAQKNVLVTINHAPYGTIFYTEGLRAVVGVTSGIDEHDVDVLYLGDGAYFTMKDVERTDSARYLGTIAKLGKKLKVERESLQALGLSEADLADDVEVISRDEALALVRRADVTIDF